MKSYFSNVEKYSKLSLIPVVSLSLLVSVEKVQAQTQACDSFVVGNLITQDTAPEGVLRCRDDATPLEEFFGATDSIDGDPAVPADGDGINIGDGVDDDQINIGDQSGGLAVETNIGDEANDVLNVTG
uniref:hypothetical protein n=1 Tax=Picosynechococcus sp. NKBG042902 TaxID=490193 RepID=UPI0005EDDE49